MAYIHAVTLQMSVFSDESCLIINRNMAAEPFMEPSPNMFYDIMNWSQTVGIFSLVIIHIHKSAWRNSVTICILKFVRNIFSQSSIPIKQTGGHFLLTCTVDLNRFIGLCFGSRQISCNRLFWGLVINTSNQQVLTETAPVTEYILEDDSVETF